MRLLLVLLALLLLLVLMVGNGKWRAESDRGGENFDLLKKEGGEGVLRQTETHLTPVCNLQV